MSIPKDFTGKYFFHFTHIENLESILKNGFLCTNGKEKKGIEHTNIASETIQHRRSEMDVTCEPNGKVHDYIPFYFATTNPMLLSLTNNKNIDQPFMIFLAIQIDKIVEKDVVFTDASANTNEPPNFYNDPKDLVNLDWDAINKTKWGCSDNEERHRRMAEVLIHDSVPFDWIEAIIVWNPSFKDMVEKIYSDNEIDVPRISYSPFKGRHFYYTKFMLDRSEETLVTGPHFMQMFFEKTNKKVKKKRKSLDKAKCKFRDIEDAIKKISEKFDYIPELEGIFNLKTDNKVHSDSVSDHTIKVAENLSKNEYFKVLSQNDKNIVQLAAFLHDIGKGPKSMWKDEIQAAYPDHPADGIRMLKRILSEDFEELSNEQIRKICLCVGYHDLIGDILEKSRSEKVLMDLKVDGNELNMLIAITLADVSAINSFWHLSIKAKLPAFAERMKKEIK